VAALLKEDAGGQRCRVRVRVGVRVRVRVRLRLREMLVIKEI